MAGPKSPDNEVDIISNISVKVFLDDINICGGDINIKSGNGFLKTQL